MDIKKAPTSGAKNLFILLSLAPVVLFNPDAASRASRARVTARPRAASRAASADDICICCRGIDDDPLGVAARTAAWTASGVGYVIRAAAAAAAACIGRGSATGSLNSGRSSTA